MLLFYLNVIKMKFLFINNVKGNAHACPNWVLDKNCVLGERFVTISTCTSNKMIIDLKDVCRQTY